MEGDGTMPKVFPMPPSTPGQTQATAAQQDAADFLHPDDAQKRDSHLKRLMRGKWDKIAATPLGIMCLPYFAANWRDALHAEGAGAGKTAQHAL